MKTLSLFHFLFLFTLLSSTLASFSQQFSPPATAQDPVSHDMHGTTLTDPFEWLEDKKNQKVIDWTRSQHDYTLGWLNEHAPAVDGLRDEIAAYLDRDITGPIQLRGDRQFFYRKQKGESQYKLYTRLGDKDILVFDPLKLDPSGKSAMTGVDFTKEAERVAVGVQNKGAEISTYYILDTKTGKEVGPAIEGLRGFSWTKDEKHAYITVGTMEMLEKQIPLKTYRHKLGTSRDKDEYLGAPKDAKNLLGYSDARYEDVTFISEGDFYSNTIKMYPIGKPDQVKVIYSSTKNRAYGFPINGKIYFFTNDNAPNFKLMVADLDRPEYEHWRTLIPESEDQVIEDYSITEKHILLRAKKDVISRLLLYDLEGNFIKEIETPEVANVSNISYHRKSKTLYVSLATFTSPGKLYKVDPETFEWELFYQQDNPLNTSEIESEIKFYTSKDGARVPIFIMYKKGTKLDGSNPALLYGYGGFNIGMTPGYIGTMATFVNRGGVYAIAGIRGGDEFGESWHEDGMLDKKQNSFDDFIAAAEYLIDEGYSSSERLAVRGGSNGGLLMGAMITQRPDLFRAVICAVPLLDMVRYHKFLIARYWIPEYGDPDKPEDFRNILQYSPYHNIRVGVDYPETMVIAGENDTRVDPLHAKKFVAAVQSNIGQKSPFMLYMDYDSGHGSGKSTEQQITDLEYQMRFVMGALGMK
jgi:prolyl oligopeptidase